MLNILAKAEELESVIATAQAMKRNITGYTEYTDYITSADQFDSNAKEPNEGSYAALLDGDPTTFFHSQWSTGWADKMPHDLQVKLPGNELTELVVRYGARYNASTNNNGDWISQCNFQGSCSLYASCHPIPCIWFHGTAMARAPIHSCSVKYHDSQPVCFKAEGAEEVHGIQLYPAYQVRWQNRYDDMAQR